MNPRSETTSSSIETERQAVEFARCPRRQSHLFIGHEQDRVRQRGFNSIADSTRTIEGDRHRDIIARLYGPDLRSVEQPRTFLVLHAVGYFLAHGCNLSCQQCSHYSNFHVVGKLPTVEEADAEYWQWSHRLKPKRFALLGGEPLLNPSIIEHIQLARQHWPDSELMLGTNDFFPSSLPRLTDRASRNTVPTRR